MPEYKTLKYVTEELFKRCGLVCVGRSNNAIIHILRHHNRVSTRGISTITTYERSRL